MGSIPQMKDLFKLKNKGDDSLLVYATRSKNAVMFDAVLTFVEQKLSSQEVIRISEMDTFRVQAKEPMSICVHILELVVS